MTKQQKDEKDIKEFYSQSSDDPLRDLQEQGYSTLYMPELTQKRINSERKSKFWNPWITSISIKATGKTINKTPVVLYVHTQNYTSDPILRKTLNRVIMAGIMPEKEFLRLLKLGEGGDKKVLLVPYYKLRNSPSGIMSIDDALDHPQTIPFLGGEDIAKNYLKKHKEFFGNEIGIYHSNDLSKEPAWRWLYISQNLSSDNSLYDDTLFLGLK